MGINSIMKKHTKSTNTVEIEQTLKQFFVQSFGEATKWFLEDDINQ